MNGRRRSWRVPPVPVLLALLALRDLRTELQLLSDHFTWTSLAALAQHHPLALMVLLLMPWLWTRFR